MIPILRGQNWYCPNCGLRDTTAGPRPNRYHTCPALHGLTAPLLPESVKAKVTAQLREADVGTELVQTAPEDGKPYMTVTTLRDEGQDVIVFAPTISINARA